MEGAGQLGTLFVAERAWLPAELLVAAADVGLERVEGATFGVPVLCPALLVNGSSMLLALLDDVVSDHKGALLAAGLAAGPELISESPDASSSEALDTLWASGRSVVYPSFEAL